MVEETKESGLVTALSIVGFVFGLIAMLGSFIPCIGALAFFLGIPAAIISAIAIWLANFKGVKKTFCYVALTISLIGVAISGFQYFSIMVIGEGARQQSEQMQQETRQIQ